VDPNPQIDFANSPFYVNTELKDWNANGGKRRAAVSSFGIGGTNAHMVVEEAPAIESGETLRQAHLLLLSARSEAALTTASQQLATHLGNDAEVALADVAYTLQVGRTAHSFRRSVVCSSVEEAIAALTSTTAEVEATSEHVPSLVWMFPGQGAQRLNMARDLYTAEPAFREALDACAEGLLDVLGLDLRELLYPSQDGGADAQASLTQTSIAQPAMFAVEYAVSRLLQSYGLQPDAMIGHSIGEYVAACLAGVFSLQDGLKLVAARGRLMQAMPMGRMLSVPEGEETLRTRISGSSLDIAAVNENDRCVVSGPAEAINALRDQLAAQGIDSRELETSHAFHSAMMDPMLDAWRSVLNTVSLNAPEIPYVSNLTGNFIAAHEATDTEYWVQHLRSTVRFADGLDTLLSTSGSSERPRVLIEVGPGQVLSNIAKRRSSGRAHVALPTLGRSSEQGDDSRTLHRCIGRLWSSGISIDWSGYHANARMLRVPLPTYPFERRRFWVEATQHLQHQTMAPDARRPSREDWFYAPLWRLRAAGPGAGVLPSEALTWVLMCDAGGVGDHLANELRQAGQHVVVVRRGDAFVRFDQDGYALVADEERHYVELAEAMKSDGLRVGRLVHLWSMDPLVATDGSNRGIADYASFEAHQRTGYFSLMFAIRGLMARQEGDGLAIHAVTQDAFRVTGYEELAPECATIVGLCKVVPQEYPSLRCQHIDFSRSDRHDRNEEFAVSAGRQLFGEILDIRGHSLVAFRRSARWTQSYEQQKVSSEHMPARIKRAGVYVITGGLGNVGYAIATHLAAMATKLVLIVRDELPARSEWNSIVVENSPSDPLVSDLGRLLVLESRGAQLLVCKADVTDESQMLDAFERAEVRFGKVDGVIHCAGQVRDSAVPLSELTLADVHAQFLPKVKGSMVLQRALKHREVDFCLLMSSLSVVLGGHGFSAYAAANAYMDAFAAARHARGDEAWLSIDWDGWRFSGESRDSVAYGMSGEEGAEALVYALSWSDVPQLVHSTGDLRYRIEKSAEMTSPESVHGRLYSRANATTLVPPTNAIESQLVEIWQQLLGIEEIGIREAFFEVGGDSLLATILVARINQTFDVNLPIRIVFEEETIERIAQKIDGLTKRPPQGKPLALKSAGDRSPLFCVHPGSGFGRPYLALLRHLPADIPVYALEARGLNDGDVLPETLDDMCADYIEQIQVIQPEGPYHLLGWSFGAICAHAMAAQMQRRGLPVAKVVMIDPTPLDDDPWPDYALEEHRLDLELRLSGYKDYQDASDELKKMMISRMSAIHGNNTRLSYYRDPKPFHGNVLIVVASDSDQPETFDLFKNYVRGNVVKLNAPYHHNILMTTEALEFYGPRISDFLDAEAVEDVEHQGQLQAEMSE
jgi:polyketide synthase PksJ